MTVKNKINNKKKKKVYSIKIKTFEPYTLNRIANQLKPFEKENDTLSIAISFHCLPIKIKKVTVLRSPHVFKKSREQMETRTYSYVISIYRTMGVIDQKLNDTFINNILYKLTQLNGISLEVHKKA